MRTGTAETPKQDTAGHSVQRLAASILSVLFLLRAAFDAFYPLRQAKWMIYAEDDYFYYWEVAQNIAAGHGSTFNGLVRTNGYHPLWLALLAAVARVFPSEMAMRSFLACFIFISTVTTYLLLRRLFDSHLENRLFTTSLAILLTLYSEIVLEGGMETLLTFPLLLAVLLVYQSDRLWRAKTTAFFGFGLLLSLTIFSRLDTLVLVVLPGVATGLQPQAPGGDEWAQDPGRPSRSKSFLDLRVVQPLLLWVVAYCVRRGETAQDRVFAVETGMAQCGVESSSRVFSGVFKLWISRFFPCPRRDDRNPRSRLSRVCRVSFRVSRHIQHIQRLAALDLVFLLLSSSSVRERGFVAGV